MFNFQVLIILILSFIILSFNSGSFPIAGVDEGRFAQSAANMLSEQELLIPTFDEEVRLEKPILFYWEQMLSFLVFGKNEFATRLPSIIAGTGMVYLAYILGAIQGTPIFASLILLSSLGLSIFSKLGILDMSFTFLVSASLSFFFLSYFHKTKAKHIFNRQSIDSRIYFYISSITLALAILCKGPLALVLITLVGLIFLLKEKEVFHFFSNKKYDAITALILLCLIAAPWYIYIHLKTSGGFSEEFFLNDNINRFFSPFNNHKGPIWFYVLGVILLLFPWSFFIPQAFFGDTSSNKISRITITDHTNSLKSFNIIWFLVVFIFFSLAQTKLITYILPLMLPLSLLIAKYCSDLINSDNKNFNNKNPDVYFSYIGILLSLPVSAFIALSYFGEKLSELSNSDISFFIILITIIFSCSTIIAITAIKENSRFSFAILILSSLVIINMFINFIGIPIAKSLDNGIKDFCKSQYHEGLKIFSYKLQRGSIGFYCNTSVSHVSDEANINANIIKAKSFYIITRKRHLADFSEALMSKISLIKENDDFVYYFFDKSSEITSSQIEAM